VRGGGNEALREGTVKVENAPPNPGGGGGRASSRHSQNRARNISQRGNPGTGHRGGIPEADHDLEDLSDQLSMNLTITDPINGRNCEPGAREQGNQIITTGKPKVGA
jgi:hypothetical protein